MPENSGWDILLNEWRCSFYSDFLTFAGILIALIASIKFWRRNYLHYLFFIYIVVALIVLIVLPISGAVIFKVPTRTRSFLNEFANIIYLISEFVTLFFFFLHLLNHKVRREYFIAAAGLFGLSVAYLSTKAFDNNFFINDLRHLVDLIFSVELLFFGGMCVYYFYDIVRDSSMTDLFQRPSFWIVSGLLLYCLAIAPFLVIAGIIINTHHSVYNILYAVHYVSLALFFLTIARAFTFKMHLTT
jgi:hypothetical protein